MAEAFADAGARLALLDLELTGLDAVAAPLRDAGRAVYTHVC